MANWNIKWNIDGIKKFNGRFFYSNRKYFNIIKQYIYKKKRISKTKTYIHFKYMAGSRDILKCYLRIEYFISTTYLCRNKKDITNIYE